MKWGASIPCSKAYFYGMVSLAAYILTTADIYMARGVEWFLYFVLIPVTISLGVHSYWNMLQERKGMRFAT